MYIELTQGAAAIIIIIMEALWKRDEERTNIQKIYIFYEEKDFEYELSRVECEWVWKRAKAEREDENA